jgi:hypothetical protein
METTKASFSHKIKVSVTAGLIPLNGEKSFVIPIKPVVYNNYFNANTETLVFTIQLPQCWCSRLERSPHIRMVMSSNLGCVKPKSLK